MEMKSNCRPTRCSYRDVLAARLRVGLTDEPVQTTTFNFLKNAPSLRQFRLGGMKDPQVETVIHPGVGDHVCDGLRQFQHVPAQTDGQTPNPAPQATRPVPIKQRLAVGHHVSDNFSTCLHSN